MRRFAFVLLFICSPLLLPAQSVDTYQVPPKELADLIDAPLTPELVSGPGEKALLLEVQALLTLADLAQPEAKLAGLRFNPVNHTPTRAPHRTSITLLDLRSGQQTKVTGLPSGLKARWTTWSPDGARFAFTHATDTGLELWIGDASKAAASRLGNVLLNASNGQRPYWWRGDDTLVVRAIPRATDALPSAAPVPAGPVIQENLGRRTPGRTYQDLLRNAYDEQLFEHHLRSEIAVVSLDASETRIGEAGLVLRAEPSPDGNFLIVETAHRPFSYVVPSQRFPRRIEIVDAAGKLVRQIADLPLLDNVSTDFDAAPEGARAVSWRSDRPATVVWAEALDKGNPRTDAAVRDRVLMLAAPFTGEPQQLATTAYRFGGIMWGNGDLAMLNESWWKTRRTRTWRLRPDRNAQPELIVDRSFEDRYGDPGTPVMRMNSFGRYVIRTSGNGEAIFLDGDGASPEGDRPFLDRFDLRTKKAARLWRSEAPHYEYPVEMIDETRLVTRRESVNEPPNYFVRDLRRRTSTALTRFPHPTPQLATARKELIRYKRADGVDLTATLYLPPGYDPARDGRLPVLMWAYPQEFKTADAAGQVSDSPYRFIRPTWGSPLPFLVRGYAILDDPSIPIIGEGDREPNDTYVQQLVTGAQAAVDEVVRRGVGDRNRIAVGGHSYGAFMTANLLAHSDLFRAGIARSGAYNRTLTPFSFQAEERTFWEATPTYMEMSPFTHAQKINEPILLIHGIDDDNTGTFPIQSERLYQALKGLGGTARLVMLPYEAHGYRARESVLHMLWEMDRWLTTYVKSAPVAP